MAAKLKFYIGERSNPQFKNSYYRAYGQLTKKDVKTKESPVYGSMFLTLYNTEKEYAEAIEKLKNEGFNVH
jgi:hypothetical protein